MQAGRIYPTVYATREAYERTYLPPDTRRFVIIRDLRDTLVSAYFSIKISHPIVDPSLLAMRALLCERSEEDGLVYLLTGWLKACAAIQRSWIGAPGPVMKYEDLLEHDQELLSRALLEHCGLPVEAEQLRAAIAANRFEKLTGGRLRGQDSCSHEREGMPQDWRRHFTASIKELFKAHYSDLLIATGYESDDRW